MQTKEGHRVRVYYFMHTDDGRSLTWSEEKLEERIVSPGHTGTLHRPGEVVSIVLTCKQPVNQCSKAAHRAAVTRRTGVAADQSPEVGSLLVISTLVDGMASAALGLENLEAGRDVNRKQIDEPPPTNLGSLLRTHRNPCRDESTNSTPNPKSTLPSSIVVRGSRKVLPPAERGTFPG